MNETTRGPMGHPASAGYATGLRPDTVLPIREITAILRRSSPPAGPTRKRREAAHGSAHAPGIDQSYCPLILEL